MVATSIGNEMAKGDISIIMRRGRFYDDDPAESQNYNMLLNVTSWVFNYQDGKFCVLANKIGVPPTFGQYWDEREWKPKMAVSTKIYLENLSRLAKSRFVSGTNLKFFFKFCLQCPHGKTFCKFRIKFL